jgi:ribonuclease III
MAERASGAGAGDEGVTTDRREDREREGPHERPEGALPARPLEELEEAIGYAFKDRDLLRKALVHKSYLHEVPEFPLGSNERLEFLGDSVLGFIVSGDLYREHPGMAEGQLTALRGALVRMRTLAEIGAPIALGDYLYMSRGEEAAGGRERPTNRGRAVEALLGAVYLDGGLRAAGHVWHRLAGKRTVEELEEVLRGDYKTRLQQFTQAGMKETPRYHLAGTSGPDHDKHFVVEVRIGDQVLATGEGHNR